jgi:Flp pilus assembly protein TadD
LPGQTFDPSKINFKSYTVVKKRMSLPKGSVVRDCGPEALSEMFRFHGTKISVDEISKKIYDPQLKATLVAKVMAYCQEVGFRAVPRRGSIADLRAAIQENRPVIIMVRIHANLAHFFIVAGYSDDEKTIVCPYYDNQVMLLKYPDMLYLWESADYLLLDLIPIDDPYERGQQHEINRKFREAVVEYETALKRDPEHFRAWIGIGNCHAQIGQIREARDAYEKALGVYANDPQALNNLADCLISLNERKADAVELAKKSAHLYVQHVENLKRTIQETTDETDRADVQAQLEQTLRRMAFSYGTWGQALMANGRYADALEPLQKSFDLMPAILRNYKIKRLREMARCYDEIGKPDRSQTLRRQADDLEKN